ncbi:MAG: hypothetical protein V2B19_33080 [Pseudomonadota bacterium]
MLFKVFGFCLLSLFFFISDVVSADLKTSQEHYSWRNGVFRVPLTIKDNSGVTRVSWPVTTGVPLPYGLCHDTGQLRLDDAEGHEIPCQFEVLSRYWARDRSIRWVLLDFQVTLKPNQKQQLFLTNESPAEKITAPINIREEKDRFEIVTGALRAVIPKTGGTVFERVEISGNPVIVAGREDGPFIWSGEVHQMAHFQGNSWNTHGWDADKAVEKTNIIESIYRGALFDRGSAIIENAGPMRVVILIKGRHHPVEKRGGILSDGLYNYTIRLHFYRGKTYVKAEYAIENSDRHSPLYNHMFRQAGLEHRLKLDEQAVATAGGVGAMDGIAPVGTVSLKKDQSVWLHQLRGENTQKYGRNITTSGGYVVGVTSAKTSAPVVLAQGSKGRYVDIADDKKGLAMATRYFWEEAPMAIEASAKQVRIDVHARKLPTEGVPSPQPAYDLDFGERTIHDLLYYFHTGTAREADVEAVAEAFEYPLFAYAPPAWYADTEAWYFEISPEMATPNRSAKTDGHWIPEQSGFRGHGYMHGYNSGGHHESENSGWLSFLRSGNLQELGKNLVLSRWSIAHNPGWCYERNRLQFGQDESKYRVLDETLQDWDQLTGFGRKDFYLWLSNETYIAKTNEGTAQKYRGGETYFNKYKWLPDIEHYALFRLFEYYYLTGDKRALDAIHGMVNWAINYQHNHLFKRKMPPLKQIDLFEKDPDALRRGHYSRIYTWMLYTTLAGYQTTESPVFEEYASWQIRRMLALLRHRHGQLTSWAPEPSKIIGVLPKDMQDKISQHLDFDILRQNSEVSSSRAQTWMEAQGVLTLHEAYKTYQDERILDGIWGLADYFSHHVLFFPRLGMVNNWTSMPNAILKDTEAITPLRHDRLIQIWPILYHYTGWKEVNERYRSFETARRDVYVSDWFLQTGEWEQKVRPKTSGLSPEKIADLRVVRAERKGITLSWTSPKDDGESGHAQRYFVKYSHKPIVPFAPTDNPRRFTEKNRIVKEIETAITGKSYKNKRDHKIIADMFTPEDKIDPLYDPKWHEVDAFWMAEHVSGEPDPSPAGQTEIFTVKKLNPHNWFGLKELPDLDILPAGTYFFAVCSWDSDRNLSELSNVVTVKLP